MFVTPSKTANNTKNPHGMFLLTQKNDKSEDVGFMWIL